VAVKFLPTRWLVTVQLLERFQREARAASALNHPTFARFTRSNSTSATFYRDGVAGGLTLAAADGAPGFEIEKLLPLAIQIADALESAQPRNRSQRHQTANIFITDRDR